MTVANPPLDPTDGAASEHLANLQALTDSSLTQLDVDDLLRELLTRVRVILDVDTAAVLTLQPQSDALVARVAQGIEDEVRQGVRVPLGAGFAGRVAATRAPVVLDHVDASTVTNPILWEMGIETMLGVPLQSGNELLGVLHVGRLSRRPFSDREVELLQVVAERVAAAIQTRQLNIERAATTLLERSLLPSRLPAPPGLRVATRFAAAEEYTVGGDWYDLFELPSGQLWVIVGDVAGHGLGAAVTMGRIRSALRAYTMLDIPPERALDLVDRKVRHFEIGTIATVLCAALDPPYDSMRLAVAGHLPPVLAAPGRPAELVDTIISAPIGTPWSIERSSTTIPIERGSVVAFYTDGLVERRGEVLDVGMERLRRATKPGPPEEVARDIMHRLIGSTVTRDDVALVVMQRE
ncbi:MAG TPA: GAF domain-containing SpoIIE family protein phosphatase [Acidimicrobiia bacterium]|nr:GAF domain-containing SpoIIE family protein phosphatase [Acidimicrobiia bacterium]